MAKAFFSAVIEHPVEAVWSKVGDFHGIDTWVSSIIASEPDGGLAVGSRRQLTLADGRNVSERLLACSDIEYSLSYDFFDCNPFPVDNFVGTVKLAPIKETGHTFLDWSSVFDADGAGRAKFESVFANLYAGFVADLRTFLNN